MEFTVAKKDLLKLVTRMQGVAERKSTMPVLSNVLLAVDGPTALRIAATDLYLALFGRVTAEIGKGGSVAVSAKDLFERVKMMPDGPIHIATQDKRDHHAQGRRQRPSLHPARHAGRRLSAAPPAPAEGAPQPRPRGRGAPGAHRQGPISPFLRTRPAPI